MKTTETNFVLELYELKEFYKRLQEAYVKRMKVKKSGVAFYRVCSLKFKNLSICLSIQKI